MKSIFITGVDTNIGKTFTSVGLCLLMASKGKKTAYYKPLQSGAKKKDGILNAPDVDELRKYTNIEAKYSYLFEGEISPHLATIINNIDVDINVIKNDLNNIKLENDFTIIEGAGGLFCPAYKGVLFSDLIKELNEEIIIVTTPSLGRLNHLLMTIYCAKKENIKIKGIIINNFPKSPTKSEENFIKELKQFSNTDILGIIPTLNNPKKDEIIKEFSKIEL